MTQQAPPFAAQRLVFIALLTGMVMFAIVTGFVIQTNDGRGLGEPPLAVLDTVAIALGVGAGAGALLLRSVLRRRADGLEAEARGGALFLSRLVPLAVLEGGCLFGITVWLLNGNAVPGLAVALVLIAIALAITPFSDPEATA